MKILMTAKPGCHLPDPIRDDPNGDRPLDARHDNKSDPLYVPPGYVLALCQATAASGHRKVGDRFITPIRED